VKQLILQLSCTFRLADPLRALYALQSLADLAALSRLPTLSAHTSHCILRSPCTPLHLQYMCCHTSLTSALSCAFHLCIGPHSRASDHIPAPRPVSPWLPLSISYHPYHTFLPSPSFLDSLAMLLVYNACNYTLDDREFSTLLPSRFRSLRAPCSSPLAFPTVPHARAALAKRTRRVPDPGGRPCKVLYSAEARADPSVPASSELRVAHPSRSRQCRTRARS
jgi:hypothetical protein